MALEDVLARIPGLAGYRAQQQFDDRRNQSALGQLLGVVNMVEQQKQRELQAEQIRETIAARKAQEARIAAEDARKTAARTDLKGVFEGMFPPKVGLPQQMDAADNVMTPGAVMQDPRAGLLRGMAELDPGGLSDIARGMLGNRSAGGAGADPMLTKILNDREAARQRGDTESVALYDQMARRLAAGYTPLQLGTYQGQNFNQAQRNADLADRGVPVPMPGRQPMPGQQPSVAFPSNGYAGQNPSQSPAVTEQLMNEAGTNRDLSSQSALRGAAGAISPRDEREVTTAITKKIESGYGEAFTGAQQAASMARTDLSKIKRIDQLLGQYEGGKLSNTGLQIARFANSLGLKVDENLPNKEAAESLTKEFALVLRSTGAQPGTVGMPGNMSDADRDFLQSISPQMAQSAQGRKLIIETMTKVRERQIEIAKQMREWRQANGDRRWDEFNNQIDQYTEKNPMFKGATTEKAGQYEVGKIYKDAKGNRARYNANGQWEPVQ